MLPSSTCTSQHTAGALCSFKEYLQGDGGMDLACDEWPVNDMPGHQANDSGRHWSGSQASDESEHEEEDSEDDLPDLLPGAPPLGTAVSGGPAAAKTGAAAAGATAAPPHKPAASESTDDDDMPGLQADSGVSSRGSMPDLADEDESGDDVPLSNGAAAAAPPAKPAARPAGKAAAQPAAKAAAKPAAARGAAATGTSNAKAPAPVAAQAGSDESEVDSEMPDLCSESGAEDSDKDEEAAAPEPPAPRVRRCGVLQRASVACSKLLAVTRAARFDPAQLRVSCLERALSTATACTAILRCLQATLRKASQAPAVGLCAAVSSW